MKFISKAILIAFSILSSSNALAWPYDNFYVGGNIGGVGQTDKEKTNNPINDSHNLSALGLIGGGLVGVDFTLHHQLKLGVEGFVNATNVNISDKQNYPPVTSYTVNMYNNLGLRILPGIEFMPGTLGHIILGYASGKFKINDNGNYGIVNSEFRQGGFQCGLGLITALRNNLFIRPDVLYTSYGSQVTHGLTTTIPTTTQNYHNNFSTVEGNLALVYKFG